MFFSIVIVLAFAYFRWGLDWAIWQRWGEQAGRFARVGDTAVLPLVVLTRLHLCFAYYTHQ